MGNRVGTLRVKSVCEVTAFGLVTTRRAVYVPQFNTWLVVPDCVPADAKLTVLSAVVVLVVPLISQ